jgi:pyruvate dehydrogenase E2 component (dihydrolipoamide acetyltransferase)/2-oxoisovalerate dehydrogenase E2 component (dihydrolipoyl transacylase)
MVEMRRRFDAEPAYEGIKVTFVPFFLRALSLCIQKYPLLNSSLDMRAKKIILHKPHNLGVAMAAPFGLIVPVIKGVEKMTLKQLIIAYDDLKKRAFENKLQPSDMKEGTLTLTNFGALPGNSMGGTPIINTPEAAICGVARIQKMPKVVDDAIVIRDLMNVSFSFDHRLIDGQLAALISEAFCSLLENPETLA